MPIALWKEGYRLGHVGHTHMYIYTHMYIHTNTQYMLECDYTISRHMHSRGIVQLHSIYWKEEGTWHGLRMPRNYMYMSGGPTHLHIGG